MFPSSIGEKTAPPGRTMSATRSARETSPISPPSPSTSLPVLSQSDTVRQEKEYPQG